MQISHTKRTLSNGLDVIVHEDHQLPMVAVNIWYHVGSKNERPGRTGFAHLFEHLMFEGSEHHDHGYFPPLQRAGGLLNGSTNADRTNYWEVVPTGALDLAMWMESDRMGYLLPALSEKKFTNQRDVVLNERRQNYENRPYGLAGMAMAAAMFPPDHPYHWLTIGSAEDLRAASLDLVREFFQTYYHPGNASLSLAGDVETEQAFDLAEQYFGGLAAGPKVDPVRVEAKLEASANLVLEDRVELPRLYLSWHSPAMFASDDAELDIVADVLAHGKTSRLYKSLVYERRIAADVSAVQHSREMGGQFQIASTASAGVSLMELNTAIVTAVAELAAHGPDRLRIGTRPGADRGAVHLPAADDWRLRRQRRSVERLQHLCRRPRLLRPRSATLLRRHQQRRRRGREQMAGARAVGGVERGAERPPRAGASRGRRGARFVSIDRTRLPIPGADRPFHFPRIVRRTLSNGLEIRAVRHRSVPVVAIVLLVPGGSSVDPADAHGLVSITSGLLDEGSRGQSALEIADRVARIGGDLDLDAGMDAVVIGMTTLDRFFETGLEIVHEIVTAPNLENDDFNRIRNLRLERLKQMKDHAAALAERAYARVLYGSHPYGHLSLGSEAALTTMTLDGVRDLHAAMFAPAGSTLVVVGDRPEEELLDVAAKMFDPWRAALSAAPIDRDAALLPPPEMPAVKLGVVSRPGAAQSELRIGHVCAPRSTPDYPALLILNTILGGDFVSRLNLNLREAKGYTYGVRTGFNLRRGIGPFVMQTSVGTDVTGPAIQEALAEIRAIAADRPATPEEVALAFASLSKGYPRGFETAGQVARSVAQLALHNLPDSYFEEFVPKLSRITAEDVASAARRYLLPAKMTTLIVGDLDKIHGSLPGLGLGPHQLLTADL